MEDPEKGPFVPARQAYSHSASVGRRYTYPFGGGNFLLRILQYSVASNQDVFSTGNFGDFRVLGFSPTSFSYCSWVTSNCPSQKSLEIVVKRCVSLGNRPSSPCRLPLPFILPEARRACPFHSPKVASLPTVRIVSESSAKPAPARPDSGWGAKLRISLLERAFA